MDQTSPTAQIAQLSSVRDLVLKDPSYWPQVVETVLSVITGKIELRRWGADFLAETFSTPVVDARAKGELALKCLDSILLLVQEKETNILKSIVQCAASIYPMVFKHM
jgi:symplekin